MAKRTNTKEKKERKTREKKTKDKDAPKRAISAFFFFQKARRETLKKEQPSLDNKRLISTMSTEWNGFGDHDKIPYIKLAEADKARYEKEKSTYEAKKPIATSAAKKSNKKVVVEEEDVEDENNDEVEGEDDEEE